MILSLNHSPLDKNKQFIVQSLLNTHINGQNEEFDRILYHVCRCNYIPVTRIISDKYKFIWFATWKVLSASILYTLRSIDPEIRYVRYIRQSQFARQYRKENNNYFTFGFIRNPEDRIRSCCESKIIRSKTLLYNKVNYMHRYYGLSSDMDFESFYQ